MVKQSNFYSNVNKQNLNLDRIFNKRIPQKRKFLEGNFLFIETYLKSFSRF